MDDSEATVVSSESSSNPPIKQTLITVKRTSDEESGPLNTQGGDNDSNNASPSDTMAEDTVNNGEESGDDDELSLPQKIPKETMKMYPAKHLRELPKEEVIELSQALEDYSTHVKFETKGVSGGITPEILTRLVLSRPSLLHGAAWLISGLDNIKDDDIRRRIINDAKLWKRLLVIVLHDPILQSSIYIQEVKRARSVDGNTPTPVVRIRKDLDAKDFRDEMITFLYYTKNARDLLSIETIKNVSLDTCSRQFKFINDNNIFFYYLKQLIIVHKDKFGNNCNRFFELDISYLNPEYEIGSPQLAKLLRLMPLFSHGDTIYDSFVGSVSNMGVSHDPYDPDAPPIAILAYQGRNIARFDVLSGESIDACSGAVVLPLSCDLWSISLPDPYGDEDGIMQTTRVFPIGTPDVNNDYNVIWTTLISTSNSRRQLVERIYSLKNVSVLYKWYLEGVTVPTIVDPLKQQYVYKNGKRCPVKRTGQSYPGPCRSPLSLWGNSNESTACCPETKKKLATNMEELEWEQKSILDTLWDEANSPERVAVSHMHIMPNGDIILILEDPLFPQPSPCEGKKPVCKMPGQEFSQRGFTVLWYRLNHELIKNPHKQIAMTVLGRFKFADFGETRAFVNGRKSQLYPVNVKRFVKTEHVTTAVYYAPNGGMYCPSFKSGYPTTCDVSKIGTTWIINRLIGGDMKACNLRNDSNGTKDALMFSFAALVDKVDISLDDGSELNVQDEVWSMTFFIKLPEQQRDVRVNQTSFVVSPPSEQMNENPVTMPYDNEGPYPQEVNVQQPQQPQQEGTAFTLQEKVYNGRITILGVTTTHVNKEYFFGRAKNDHYIAETTLGADTTLKEDMKKIKRDGDVYMPTIQRTHNYNMTSNRTASGVEKQDEDDIGLWRNITNRGFYDRRRSRLNVELFQERNNVACMCFQLSLSDVSKKSGQDNTLVLAWSESFDHIAQCWAIIPIVKQQFGWNQVNKPTTTTTTANNTQVKNERTIRQRDVRNKRSQTKKVITTTTSTTTSGGRTLKPVTQTSTSTIVTSVDNTKNDSITTGDLESSPSTGETVVEVVKLSNTKKTKDYPIERITHKTIITGHMIPGPFSSHSHPTILWGIARRPNSIPVTLLHHSTRTNIEGTYNTRLDENSIDLVTGFNVSIPSRSFTVFDQPKPFPKGFDIGFDKDKAWIIGDLVIGIDTSSGKWHKVKVFKIKIPQDRQMRVGNDMSYADGEGDDERTWTKRIDEENVNSVKVDSNESMYIMNVSNLKKGKIVNYKKKYSSRKKSLLGDVFQTNKYVIMVVKENPMNHLMRAAKAAQRSSVPTSSSSSFSASTIPNTQQGPVVSSPQTEPLVVDTAKKDPWPSCDTALFDYKGEKNKALVRFYPKVFNAKWSSTHVNALNIDADDSVVNSQQQGKEEYLQVTSKINDNNETKNNNNNSACEDSLLYDFDTSTICSSPCCTGTGCSAHEEKGEHKVKWFFCSAKCQDDFYDHCDILYNSNYL